MVLLVGFMLRWLSRIEIAKTSDSNSTGSDLDVTPVE